MKTPGDSGEFAAISLHPPLSSLFTFSTERDCHRLTAGRHLLIAVGFVV